MENLINCSKISVDCAYNDPVDIKAGGSEMLGFDFFVESIETDEMIKFVMQTLKETNVPLISIGVTQKNLFLTEKEIWTKPRIAESILKDAEYIRIEASRNYKPLNKTKVKLG